VVVLLDRRLTEQRYGEQFLRSLPPMSVSNNLDDIRLFLSAKSRAA